MAKPKFKKGFVHVGTNKSSGSNNIDTLEDALKEQAKCDPCGCDPCLGYWTFINVDTGTLTAVYVSGTDEAPTLVVQPLEDALPTLKAAKDARG